MADAAEEFIEMMGRHFEEEGTARIAGRLVGVLMLTEAPASLDELAERLQVSKGSISLNARLLEDWGIAERITRPGDRRDFYRIAPDVNTRLLERQIARIQVLDERMATFRARLEPMSDTVRSRLDRAMEFNGAAVRSFQRMLEEFRGSHAAE
jgi:DNA-binding transcriptional regulator GbsR (MarR family)